MTQETEQVREWLETAALAGKKLVRTQPLTGGYRNENLLVECSDGSRYVLRRYRGEARAEVEAALARRLSGLVPVAQVIAEAPGGGALLLDYVPGTPVDVLLPTLAVEDAETVGAEAGRVLAAIGTVRFDRDGFFTDGSLRPRPLDGDLATFVDACLGRMAPGWELSTRERDDLRCLAARLAPLVDAITDGAHLVHSDFNPKNLLAARERDGWRITVLDWEFAFSGSPLTDLGNVLRFGETAFTRGVVAGHGPPPGNWRETARALDLFALADFLTREPKPPLADRIRRVIVSGSA
jgi:fructokinase